MDVMMTPQQFIAKWKQADLSERSACQQHFLDLCELLVQPKPAEVDPTGQWYTFERGVEKSGGGKPKHAARQLANGRWTSKLGELEDIEHTLNGLDGIWYGSVMLILKRALSMAPGAPAMT
jgi:hypothetical protein